MPHERATAGQVEVIHHYLERQFPGRVNNAWWNPQATGPTFEITHDAVRHQIEVASAFLEDCPDWLDNLHHSELVDYIREARTQNRRFLIWWQGGEVRIRSKPL